MIWRTRRIKLLVAAAWLAVLAAGLGYAWLNDISAGQIVGRLYSAAENNPWAPVIYVLLYALRPLTLLPAMWLTIASGSLFGFLPGVMLTIIGENTSAATAYWIARFFGDPADPDQTAVEEVSRFRRRLREQALPTVIVLRAAYLPFDPVNFGCGFLRVPWWPYFIGTFIGILPPMITYVSFGASVDFLALATRSDSFSPALLFDRGQLLISVILLLVSGVIAYAAHRRRQTLSRRS
ncbi:MAG: hypothetical protein CMN28_04475 [Salinisphaeraceae bacterium]|nr:hypothetical protein [Salinisphaeraceae bacterium]